MEGRIMEHDTCWCQFPVTPPCLLWVLFNAAHCSLSELSPTYSSIHWYRGESKKIKKFPITFTPWPQPQPWSSDFYQPPRPIGHGVRPAIGIAVRWKPLPPPQGIPGTATSGPSFRHSLGSSSAYCPGDAERDGDSRALLEPRHAVSHGCLLTSGASFRRKSVRAESVRCPRK